MKPVAALIIGSLLALSALATGASAEVLKLGDKVEVKRPANAPTRGMTKATVEKRYGEPLKKNPPVGKPPISSWEYPGYIVYFEGQYVLHTVATGKEERENGRPQSAPIPQEGVASPSPK